MTGYLKSHKKLEAKNHASLSALVKTLEVEDQTDHQPPLRWQKGPLSLPMSQGLKLNWNLPTPRREKLAL